MARFTLPRDLYHAKGSLEVLKTIKGKKAIACVGGETVEEKVQLLIAYLRGMNDKLNIPQCIKNYGADSYPCEQGFVPEEVFLERLPEIAKNAIADACTGSNPRQPSQEEMEKLFKCCYYDLKVDF